MTIFSVYINDLLCECEEKYFEYDKENIQIIQDKQDTTDVTEYDDDICLLCFEYCIDIKYKNKNAIQNIFL